MEAVIQYKSWKVFKSVFLSKAPFTAYPTFCIFNARAHNHCYLRLTCVESLIKGYEQFKIDILLVTRFN